MPHTETHFGANGNQAPSRDVLIASAPRASTKASLWLDRMIVSDSSSWRVPSLAVLTLLAAACPVWGQSLISGRVLDAETGAAVPDAMILLEGTGLGSVTTSVGLFELSEVPPGDWVLGHLCQPSQRLAA